MFKNSLNRILHSIMGSSKKKHNYKHYSSSATRYKHVYPPKGGSYNYGHRYYKGKYKSHSSS